MPEPAKEWQEWFRSMIGESQLAVEIGKSNILEQELLTFLVGIFNRFNKQQEILMALPDIIKAAIATEIQEGNKLVELIATQKAKIDELTALLATRPELDTETQAIVTIAELNEAIAAINPTPVSDEIVTEVIDNPEIPTPDVVETAPEVAPETVQTSDVVEAAVDAIVAMDALPE
jgi:hypothetical protein